MAATKYYTTLTSNAVSAYCDGTIRRDQLAGFDGSQQVVLLWTGLFVGVLGGEDY